jgi:hypothetical protein
MRNDAEYPWTASGLRHGTRPWAVLAAAATVLGVSMSIAAPDAVAYELHLTPSSQGPGGAPVTTPPVSGPPTKATVASAITGLDNEKPSLHFAITTSGKQPVTAVTVTLPSGLSFSDHASDLAHGVQTTRTDKPQSTTVRDGQLTVALNGSSPNVNLTIGGAALTESKRFEQSVETLAAFNQAHKSDQRSLSLKFTVTVDVGTLDSVKVPVTIVF